MEVGRAGVMLTLVGAKDCTLWVVTKDMAEGLDAITANDGNENGK